MARFGLALLADPSRPLEEDDRALDAVVFFPFRDPAAERLRDAAVEVFRPGRADRLLDADLDRVEVFFAALVRRLVEEVDGRRRPDAEPDFFGGAMRIRVRF